MYCPKCNCEFTGWNVKCPVCRTELLEVKLEKINLDSSPLDYTTLVEVIQENGGAMTIQLGAIDIETKRGRGFPYIGRGYAWAKGFEGIQDDLAVKLTTTEVGRERGFHFPYFGFGFAWEKEMQGSVSGNPVDLKAEKVVRERKMGFPYRGYGCAWVQTMSGKCGKKLLASLKITEVRKRKKWSFPYFGYGFAWANAGQLTITLA